MTKLNEYSLFIIKRSLNYKPHFDSIVFISHLMKNLFSRCLAYPPQSTDILVISLGNGKFYLVPSPISYAQQVKALTIRLHPSRNITENWLQGISTIQLQYNPLDGVCTLKILKNKYATKTTILPQAGFRT